MATLGTTNIWTSLVRDKLGESSDDINDLCTSDKVNMFSKFKPIDINRLFSVSSSEHEALNYGIIVYQIADFKNTTGKKWEWLKPTSYPKRLQDFRNYYHDAPNPIEHIRGTNYIVNRFDGGGKTIAFTIPPAPTGYELYAVDVSEINIEGGSGVLLNNYYLGCAIYDQFGIFKGTYYSYSTIKYSDGPSQDMDGATIVLNDSPYLNSEYDPIEDYAAANYTAYLFISSHGATVPIGELRENWCIYYTDENPESLNINILAASSIFEIQTLGIRPTGGSWADGSTDFKTGNISASIRGSYYRFDYKIRIKNKTSSIVYLDLSNIFIFHDRLTDYNTTPDRVSENMGSTTVDFDPYEEKEITKSYITAMPSYMQTDGDAGSLLLDQAFHFGNSESNEQLTETNSPDIRLYHEP